MSSAGYARLAYSSAAAVFSFSSPDWPRCSSRPRVQRGMFFACAAAVGGGVVLDSRAPNAAAAIATAASASTAVSRRVLSLKVSRPLRRISYISHVLGRVSNRDRGRRSPQGGSPAPANRGTRPERAIIRRSGGRDACHSAYDLSLLQGSLMDEVAIGTAVRTAGDTGTALVRVDGVRLGYWVGDAFHTAVGHATFDVRPREKMIVIGPSGCGKSTLLKAIAGFIAPVGGSITVAGRKTLAPGPDRAVVFQEFDQLFPWRTVIDNVAYPLRVNGRSRRSAKETAREFLDQTNVTVMFVTHSIEEALVLGDRVVVLGNAPSSVLEIVDLRDLGGPETVEYSRMRGHLRALLAVDEEDALDEEESL